MRKFSPIITILLCGALLLLPACQNQDDTTTPTTTPDIPDTPATQPIEPPTTTLPDGSAWVQFYNDMLPVSFIENGEQRLTADTADWYFAIEDLLGISAPPANTVTYDTNATMYADPACTPFAIAHPDAYGRNFFGATLAIDGDWHPFPVKVRYQQYAIDAQPDNAQWQAHFADLLGEYAAETPLIITEAWFFDIDADGQEEAVVNACNTVYTEDLAPNPPAKDHTALYSFCTYFNDAGQTFDLLTSSGESPTKQPLSEENYYSFLPGDTIEYFEQYVSCYQYDAAGSVTLCPIFNAGEYDRAPENQIMLADIDGDGDVELLTFYPVIYGHFIVYHFDTDLMPQRGFHITTPA